MAGESENDKGPFEWKNYLPKNIRLRATFFVNIRQSAGIQVCACLTSTSTRFSFLILVISQSALMLTVPYYAFSISIISYTGFSSNDGEG